MKNWFTHVKRSTQSLLLSLGLVTLFTETVHAATDPQAKLVEAGNTIKGILTALIVVVGGIACAKIVIKYLPSIDDPNEKNIMYKSIMTALLVTALGGSLVWLVPWAYALLA
ncbi:CagC family type IV secretion system protein [Vagococcus fluvialis]|uniref:CagC family type IV secretion system protein n=1 Tax=Lactobacillales TaxID=186826 RepID=UPI0035A17158